MSDEQFSLVWNSFPRNLSSGLYTLLTDEHLVDVTLAAEGQILRAHKLILSVCSTYFRELFKGNSCKHPIVILKDVNYRDLSAMLHFMYQGEVNIKQEDIASFLKVAETLQVKGLTKDNNELHEKLTKDTEMGHSLREEENDESKAPDKSLILEELSQSPEKSPQSPERNIGTNLRKDKSVLAKDEATFCNISNQQGSDSETENIMHTIHTMFSKRCGNVEQISPTREEPLDYTSDVGRITRAKREPIDYMSDVDVDTDYKNYTARDKTSDHREENLQRHGFNSLEAAFQNDFPHDVARFSRGRRTVKGIPGSSLPLETTLRVVSELGPTLHMERGKVIRMYSCPWCLRHFTRKENLKLHVRYIHGPLESLTCKLCGNKYKNSNSLRVHSYLYHNAKRNKHNKSSLVSGSV